MNVKQLNYSDPQILEKVGGSDDDIPYGQLYKLIYPDVEKFILSNNGNHADAKDIFQESILDFIENVKLGKYKEVGTLKAYVKTLARNRWYNLKRGAMTLDPFEGNDLDHIKEEEIPSEGERSNKETNELNEHRLLHECMAQLKEKPRKLLELYFFDNKKYKEIATLLNYKEKSVKVIAKLNRDKLKKCIESKQAIA